jgi:hypothetical protein
VLRKLLLQVHARQEATQPAVAMAMVYAVTVQPHHSTSEHLDSSASTSTHNNTGNCTSVARTVQAILSACCCCHYAILHLEAVAAASAVAAAAAAAVVICVLPRSPHLTSLLSAGSNAATGASCCRTSHTRTQPSLPHVTSSGGP